MMLKVIYELADVNRWQRTFTKSEVLPLITSFKKPVMLSFGRARCQYTICLTKYVFHTLRLVIEISVWALYDADGVGP